MDIYWNCKPLIKPSQKNLVRLIFGNFSIFVIYFSQYFQFLMEILQRLLKKYFFAIRMCITTWQPITKEVINFYVGLNSSKQQPKKISFKVCLVYSWRSASNIIYDTMCLGEFLVTCIKNMYNSKCIQGVSKVELFILTER